MRKNVHLFHMNNVCLKQELNVSANLFYFLNLNILNIREKEQKNCNSWSGMQPFFEITNLFHIGLRIRPALDLNPVSWKKPYSILL